MFINYRPGPPPRNVAAFSLSLIVPCFNEEQTIAGCIERVRDVAREQAFALEIIVVNDASTDNSLAILKDI
ncbi:MAG: glycosyltransferase, partial [Spirochaetaceae bacterium]|nr:glycosyltransferase [Spirochaetaceae bacterium]